MASASSHPKSGTNSRKGEAEIGQLLQNKAALEPVTPALLKAARHLQKLGLISWRQIEYVKCAFSEDHDFQFADGNRTCTGRIPLEKQLDENAGDCRCPECGRKVYPLRHRKRRFPELRSRVLQDGVEKYVLKLLEKGDIAVQAVDGVSGAWRMNGGVTGVYICLADYCEDDRLLSVQWAQQNPTCYVAVTPRALEKFINIEWVSKMMLADIVNGQASLVDTVRSLAADTSARPVPDIATPVFTKGGHQPKVRSSAAEQVPLGLFVMELGDKTARINSMDMLDTRAVTGHAILRELAKAFLQDLLANKAPQHFLCQTPSELANALQEATDKKDAMDADQVRRTINRLQEAFEQRLCKAGPVAEHDSIIEASPDTRKEGYRLNPFKVAIRPLLPPKTPK